MRPSLSQAGHPPRGSTYASESEAILWQCESDSCMSLPTVCLPLYVPTHEVSIHPGHGHTNTYTLELAAMITRVAIPTGV